MLWIIAVVVIAAIVYAVVSLANSLPTATNDQTSNSTSTQVSTVSQVTIMVPKDMTAYETAMNQFLQENAGTDPSKTFPFVAKSVNVASTTDVVRAAAEAAAEVIPTQASSLPQQVVYLKVVNATAYVVLVMDIDGWAGVSVAIAKVHPLVEKTLLAQPGITAVKFGPAPGDTIDSIQKAYMNRNANLSSAAVSLMSDWKTYTNSEYKFTISYPQIWSTYEYEVGTIGGLHYIHFGLPEDIQHSPLATLEISEHESNIDDLIKHSYFGDKGTWSDVLVDGIETKENIVSYGLNNSQKSLVLDFIKNGNGYELMSTVYGDNVSTVSDMISTLKFTDSMNSTVSSSTVVVSPNGGEVIDISKGITVSFIGIKDASYSINISDDSIGKSYNLDSLNTYNSQPYSPHVTATGAKQDYSVSAQKISGYNLKPGSTYRIELCTPGPSALVCDYSDNSFTITN